MSTIDSERMLAFPYRNLGDIKRQKELVLTKIRANNKEISFLCKGLVDEVRKPSKSRKSMLSSVMDSGIGVLDVALLAWKLYRRYKRKR